MNMPFAVTLLSVASVAALLVSGGDGTSFSVVMLNTRLSSSSSSTDLDSFSRRGKMQEYNDEKNPKFEKGERNIEFLQGNARVAGMATGTVNGASTTLSFSFCGDFGPRTHKRLLKRMSKMSDVAVLLGDLTYAEENENPKRFKFFKSLETSFGRRNVPVIGVLGNHDNREAEDRDFFDLAVGVSQESVPKRCSAHVFAKFATVIVMNSELGVSGEMVRWIEQTVAAVDRTRTPIIILVGHKPLVSIGQSGPEQGLRQALAAVLSQIDLYVAGHDHMILMSKPMDVEGELLDVAGHGTAAFPWQMRSLPVHPTVFAVSGLGGMSRYDMDKNRSKYEYTNNHDERAFVRFTIERSLNGTVGGVLSAIDVNGVVMHDSYFQF